MDFFQYIYSHLFFTLRFFVAMGCCMVLFVVGFFFPPMMPFAYATLWVLLALTLLDYIFLFFVGKKPTAKRITALLILKSVDFCLLKLLQGVGRSIDISIG